MGPRPPPADKQPKPAPTPAPAPPPKKNLNLYTDDEEDDDDEYDFEEEPVVADEKQSEPGHVPHELLDIERPPLKYINPVIPAETAAMYFEKNVTVQIEEILIRYVHGFHTRPFANVQY